MNLLPHNPETTLKMKEKKNGMQDADKHLLNTLAQMYCSHNDLVCFRYMDEKIMSKTAGLHYKV